MVVAHLVTFSTDLGLDAARGASLVMVLGLSGFAGMLVLGTLSDRIGGRKPWVVSAVSLSWIISVQSEVIIYPFVALYGFAWGGYAVGIPFLAAEFFGMRSVAAVVGGVQLGTATMASTGPMLSGFIFDATGSYYPAFGMGVAMFLAGAVLVFSMKAVRQAQTGAEDLAVVSATGTAASLSREGEP
jgi:cyanate permease